MAAKMVKIVSCRLVRECPSVAYPTRRISGPDDLHDLVRPFLEDADREEMLLVCCDRKNQPTHIQVISVGTLSSSPAHPREIFKAAIIANSSGIFLSHNHPSGDPTPSSEDIDLTRRMKEAGDLLGIELLDHLIVGCGCFRSLKSMSLI